MLQNQSIRQLFTDFTALIFPNYCLSCTNTLTPSEKHICLSCQSQIQQTNLIGIQPNQLHAKFFEIPHLRYAFVYAWFQNKGVLQKLIHKLKYADEPRIAEFFGETYGRLLKEYNYHQLIDQITAVPLHYLKLRKRGYNQSELIAKAISSTSGIPYRALIKKKYNRKSQTKKQRIERFENTENSFGLLSQKQISGQHILVVDDVLTTGATLQAACLPLIEKAATVSVFTIAAVK